MADHYSETSHQSFFGNLGNSIKGVGIGFLLFLASFVVLWMNEGRVNVAKIAKESVVISPDTVDQQAQGKMVAVTGKMATQEPVGDDLFATPKNYIKLIRLVESYVWVEEKHSTTHKELGGGSTTKTEYNYVKKWSKDIPQTASFKIQEGHENPSALSIGDQVFTAKTAKLGIYDISLAELHVPAGKKIVFSSAMVTLKIDEKLIELSTKTSENELRDEVYTFIFKGKGTMQNPQLGDQRIFFKGIENNENVTLLGKLDGGKIVPYFYNDTDFLYRAFSCQSKEAAIAQMAFEYARTTWLLRLLGFLMMWIGLAMLFGPINTILGIIPFLETVGTVLVCAAMFVVALVLSIVTIVVSMVAHNIIALILVLLALIGFVFWRRKRKKLTTSD